DDPHFVFRPIEILEAQAASCPAEAKAFRKRALSSGTDDLRTGLRQVAETYDALADGVELKLARTMRTRASPLDWQGHHAKTSQIKSQVRNKFPTKEQPNERIVTDPIFKRD